MRNNENQQRSSDLSLVNNKNKTNENYARPLNIAAKTVLRVEKHASLHSTIYHYKFSSNAL